MALTEEEHAELLSGFATGIRETYEGEVSVDDVDFTDALEGTMSVTFCTSTHIGCRDIDGGDIRSETVTFSIVPDDAIIYFETHPPPLMSERDDEI